MTIQNRHLGPLAISLICLALGGCELLDDTFDDDLADQCQSSEGDVEVAGQWTITGRGTRKDCVDPRFNSDGFELATSVDLPIKQDGETLTLEGQIDGFDFDGTVDGVCVDFNTVEAARDDVNNAVFRWRGTLRDDGAITGTFDGEGPNGCVSEGNFTAVIQ